MSEERDVAPEQQAPAPGVESNEVDEGIEGLAQDAAAEAPEVEEAPAAPAEPDYKDLYLRAAAETENIRKRSRRDVEVASARGVARRKIPGGGRDDLIAGDARVAKCRPMPKCPARRLDDAHDGALLRRRVVGAKARARLQRARPKFCGLCEDRNFQQTRDDPRKDVGGAGALEQG